MGFYAQVDDIVYTVHLCFNNNMPYHYKGYWNDRAKYCRVRDKKLCLEHYGVVCVCCGEKNESFLTIDHIEGRNGEGRHSNNWTWTRAHHFPIDLQVLCWNCNCAKGAYGVCPHQQPRPSKTLGEIDKEYRKTIREGRRLYEKTHRD